jgi:hypothetical protein
MVRPGKRPPSTAPRRRRQAMREPYEWQRPVRVAMIPHAVVMKAIQREGRSFLMTRLEGILDG